MHLPTASIIEAWPIFTRGNPLRILVSGCLAGQSCGVDGTSYELLLTFKAFWPCLMWSHWPFCPEQLAFGTPRATPDLHGGDGFAVLDGKARILNEHGKDWTVGMIKAAQSMLLYAQDHAVDLALLMDMSAACGSQVISDVSKLFEKLTQKSSVKLTSPVTPT